MYKISVAVAPLFWLPQTLAFADIAIILAAFAIKSHSLLHLCKFVL